MSAMNPNLLLSILPPNSTLTSFQQSLLVIVPTEQQAARFWIALEKLLLGNIWLLEEFDWLVVYSADGHCCEFVNLHFFLDFLLN
ncbi:hypothetical protein H6G23_15100 [Desertifilum sp. FACHB-866]|uniref:Uncharacterized protein n=2 Tax=Desertifilaceae TaxID=1969992 RepID=A0A1E5QQC6_9CYAN|nr:hypothetical protein [Desertifilum sp. FACHB-866]MDL5052927.1 hypothetical protein [Oscillatoria laete-virens NRMC-F 0139]OEJ76858.1 hypothetical protein BH720_02460 [Desertifilum tharense IPPAS B-1220]